MVRHKSIASKNSWNQGNEGKGGKVVYASHDHRNEKLGGPSGSRSTLSAEKKSFHKPSLLKKTLSVGISMENNPNSKDPRPSSNVNSKSKHDPNNKETNIGFMNRSRNKNNSKTNVDEVDSVNGDDDDVSEDSLESLSNSEMGQLYDLNVYDANIDLISPQSSTLPPSPDSEYIDADDNMGFSPSDFIITTNINTNNTRNKKGNTRLIDIESSSSSSTLPGGNNNISDNVQNVVPKTPVDWNKEDVKYIILSTMKEYDAHILPLENKMHLVVKRIYELDMFEI
jgi:hypothetical protein